MFVASLRKSGYLNIESDFGTWRSPVAHLLGVQGVAGSNPAVPTKGSRVLPHETERFRKGSLLENPAVPTKGSRVRICALGIPPLLGGTAVATSKVTKVSKRSAANLSVTLRIPPTHHGGGI